MGNRCVMFQLTEIATIVVKYPTGMFYPCSSAIIINFMSIHISLIYYDFFLVYLTTYYQLPHYLSHTAWNGRMIMNKFIKKRPWITTLCRGTKKTTKKFNKGTRPQDRESSPRPLDQWYSTGGTRRHLRGYVKFKISIYILFHE
jgi:hypothetical protein